MTQPPRPGPASPGDVEPTREITVPPGPPPASDAETAPEADVVPVQADQPTARLAAPEPAPPGRRSRTPYVLAALVALIVAAGVVAVLVYGG